MKTQNQVAQAAGTTQPYISNILNGRRRPSWKLAKRLAQVTCTEPQLWLDGTPDEIRAALSDLYRGACCPEKFETGAKRTPGQGG
ncbi:helix-turn-helix transcriptional regulator [Desulfatitalea tepidiphila]|uniref:helix-turn-helix transcriptional regulator n=1 Tax=Desulfatitalea tepidiphila TaxID=1185843 RepID=UPI000976987F